MFTQAGNACTTSGTLECLTVVHPANETVGDNPVRLLTSFAVTVEGNFV